MQRRPVRFAIAVAALAVLGLLFAFRAPLFRATVAAILDGVTGYHVAFDDLHVSSTSIEAFGVHVERDGEPLIDADRIDVGYRASELLSGNGRAYGLYSIDVERPHVTLVRHADGSFNVPTGNLSPGGPSAGAGSAGSHLAFTAAIRDGTVTLLDPNRVLRIARTIEIRGIDARANVDNATRSSYRASGTLTNAPSQPFDVRGRIDANGFSVHRVRAALVSIVPIADYFINTPSAEMADGVVRDLDVRFFTLGANPGGAARYHIAGSGRLEDGTMHIPGLAHPVTQMRGPIDIYDDGLVTSRLLARLDAVDVSVSGGLYDRNDPQFRLGIVADRAPLRDVKQLFNFSQALPLEGDARITTLLENQVGTPLVIARVRAPQLSYRTFPVSDGDGRAIFYRGAVDVVGAHATYGGLRSRVNGVVALGGDLAQSQFVLDANGPAARVPYAAQIAPLAALHATALLVGSGIAFDARGVADGNGGGAELSGIFHVDPSGDGSFGPLHLAQADGGTANGTFYLNRSASRSGFWLDAHDYPFARVAADPHLPGLSLAPPVFGARLDGSVAGIGPPSDFRVAGSVRARALDAGGVHIDDVAGNLAGKLTNLRLGAVDARGPWGTFRGTGAFERSTLALAGNYRGSFTQLRSITGELGARGPIDGPVDLLLSPDRTLVQARGDVARGATVDNVPVSGLAGTLAVAGKHVRVYAATASVAGGTFAAAGEVDGERGVGVSVAGADARALHGIAPLGAGRIDAIGSLRTRAHATRFDGGVALGEATLDRLPIAGNGDLTFSRNRLDVRETDGRLDDALASLDGSLAALGTGATLYDVNVHVPGAEIAPFARIAAPDRRDIAGTLTAAVRISGTAADLRVNGRVAVPEGTVNGLAFRDASAGVAVTRTGLFVRAGTVTVGSTNTTFGAAFDGSNAALRVDADRADLADFNDYFDGGDTLGGTGHVAVSFAKRGTSVRSNADIAIANLEYRRFDLGDAKVAWTSHGPHVDGKLAFGGASGRLQVAGTYVVATHAPLEKFFERSRFDGTAHLRGLDLGVWLPALGYQLPIGGRVDADATIAGPLRNPSVDTNFTLIGGSLGRFPVDRLEVSAVSTLRRTTITSAALNLPSVAMTGAGSFGLGEHDPIAFSLHAKSPDVGTVALRVAGSSLALSGAAEADVKIDGTRAKPRVSGGFDLENGSVHGVAIPQALGEFSIAGRDLVLSDAEIGLAKGTVYLAGSVPLVIAPFGFGPGTAPITLDFDARGIDLANFAPLLPQGSTLGGTLDGHVAVGGTAGDPRLDGKIGVTAGAFRGPFETVPLDGIGAQVTFSGSTARLDRLHAESGAGSIDATGKMVFANLVHPGADADYQFDARATHLALAFPAYGSGQLDGKLSVAHAPQQPPAISGELALSEATIPFAALLFADSGSGGFDTSQTATAPVVPGSVADIALNLDLSAQHNVRVRSGNVDIGARGTLHVGGTSSAPSLSGGFVSTGGTLTYFNTVFRLLDGQVTFEPDLGVIPNLDAHAITHVINPDPNTVRNITGGADVTLALHGPVTNLSIALSSDPSYDREQILGLLLSAPALGATNLFATTGQPTLYGSTQTNVPAGTAVPRNTNGEFSVAQEAFGVANAQFTRALLAPIESSVAEAVGLSNINVNVDYLGNVGVTARKILGKKVNAIYGASFGYPYRQTFGFEFKQNEVTAAQVTVFQTLGAYGLNSLTPYYLTPNNLKVQAAEPNLGTTGFSLSLQHLF